MGSRIYVGNIPFTSTEEDVRALFEQHGTVAEVKFISDRDDGRFRGFGFVTMGSDQEAADAVAALDGCELGGRKLTVNEAQERERGARGGGFRSGGGRDRGGRR